MSSIIVDLWIKRCRYERIELVAQAGADGTGTVTRTVNLNGAGVLAAVAIDYQNIPATTDLAHQGRQHFRDKHSSRAPTPQPTSPRPASDALVWMRPTGPRLRRTVPRVERSSKRVCS